MDETTGSFNRIAFSQKKLQAQSSYNQSRIFFFPFQIAFQREVMLVEAENSTLKLQPSYFQAKLTKYRFR
jgi:hypothetical protein